MGEEKIQKIETKIYDQKRQLLVKIPAVVKEKLKINPKKDTFIWAIIEDSEGISLNGFLKKNEN